MCQYLVAWLLPCVGISRNTATILLKALQLIASVFVNLLIIVFQTFGQELNMSVMEIPQDVRTAYVSIGIEPDILRTVCCPKCFSLILSMIFLTYVNGKKHRDQEHVVKH